MATGCGALPARGPWRPWSPGRPAAHRPMQTPSPAWRIASEFPRCAQRDAGGRLALDPVGVIAQRRRWVRRALRRVGRGRDGQPAAAVRSSNQARPRPRPEPQRSITKNVGDDFTYWRIKLPHLRAAKFRRGAGVSSGCALIAEWKNDRANPDSASEQVAPVPEPSTPSCAQSRLMGCRSRPSAPTGSTAPWWSTSISSSAPPRCIWARLLGESDRRYLTCDATQRPGSNATANRSAPAGPPGDQPSASPRPRAPRPCVRGSRLRSHRGLHAHHIRHWKAAGPPNWPTSCWYAPTITGCTIAASSPSPVTQTT